MPVHEFEFKRQVQGRGQAAWVTVMAEQLPGEIDIAFDDHFESTGNTRPIPQGDSEWNQGVFQGCRDAIAYAQAEGICSGGRVRIVRIDGSNTDSSLEVMRMAAFRATWEGLTEGRIPLTMTFDQGRWHIQRC